MERIISKNAPDAIGPYTHATKVSGLIFTSGQIGLNPENGKLVDGVEDQAKQALNNLKEVLKDSGSDFNHVLKATIYLDDLKNFSLVNDIYANYFDDYPARTAIEVSSLPMDAEVEIEVIAEEI